MSARMSFASVSGAIEKWLQRQSDRRRGITPEKRAWLEWSERNINPRASTVQRVFEKFTYVIEVDSNKFFNHREPFAWVPVEEAEQMTYPHRPLGNNVVWSWFRGGWSQRTWGSPGFLIDEMFGGDHVFAATNNEQDAVWIAMKWGK